MKLLVFLNHICVGIRRRCITFFSDYYNNKGIFPLVSLVSKLNFLFTISFPVDNALHFSEQSSLTYIFALFCAEKSCFANFTRLLFSSPPSLNNFSEVCAFLAPKLSLCQNIIVTVGFSDRKS